MDKIKKLLKKLSQKDRKKLEMSIALLEKRQVDSLDIKKIKSSKFFRLRIGKLRIIFFYKNKKFILMNIALRDENTYKNLKIL